MDAMLEEMTESDSEETLEEEEEDEFAVENPEYLRHDDEPTEEELEEMEEEA